MQTGAGFLKIPGSVVQKGTGFLKVLVLLDKQVSVLVCFDNNSTSFPAFSEILGAVFFWWRFFSLFVDTVRTRSVPRQLRRLLQRREFGNEFGEQHKPHERAVREGLCRTGWSRATFTDTTRGINLPDEIMRIQVFASPAIESPYESTKASSPNTTKSPTIQVREKIY